MTQEEILNYRKMCAEFLGASIFEEDKSWKVRNWNNPKDYPNRITSITPITMWGTKEETYNKVLLDQLNESFGRWGKFHSDWNWIMEVVEAVKTKIENPASVAMARFNGDMNKALMTAKKGAVVQAINQFLIWYNNENKTKTD